MIEVECIKRERRGVQEANKGKKNEAELESKWARRKKKMNNRKIENGGMIEWKKEAKERKGRWVMDGMYMQDGRTDQ